MKCDAAKVQTSQDFPTPISKKRVTVILGLINYLEPLIPDISNKTVFQRVQITNWDWNPSTDSAFQQLKAWIWIWNQLLYTTIAHNNQAKLSPPRPMPVNMALVQLHYKMATQGHLPARPSPIPKPSMQISKQNVYPNALNLKNFIPSYMTDIKPYRMSINPLKWCNTSLYTQAHLNTRMLLQMQKCNYMIQYKPCKEMILADILSRFPSRNKISLYSYTYMLTTYNCPTATWMLDKDP